MGSEHGRRFPSITRASSPLSTAVLVCLVVALSYLAPKLEGVLIQNPRTVWPFWPGSAVLVSVLLLVPGRIWPILIPAAFATFGLYDLEVGVPVKSIAWFIPANTVQVLTSALCLRYCFHGVPRLNSVTAVAKYSFFAVILAPVGAAFFSANGIGGSYWEGWRVCFLSEALAFVTLTPAILSWFTEGAAFVRKPRAYRLEAVALIAGLIFLSYVIFAEPGIGHSPALLYSLVPFLLWAALRFGSIGISSSAVLISFLTIWGAIHARGPFADQGSLNGILSLQLFLVFAALPFMVLAALVEERKVTSRELALSNERVRLAVEAGKSVGWEWDIKSGRDSWFGDLQTMFGIPSDRFVGRVEDFYGYVHPEDRQMVAKAVSDAKQRRKPYAAEFRVVRLDGTVRWVSGTGQFYYDSNGDAERMLGLAADITERKRVDEALRESEARFRLAAQAGKMFAYEWDAATDVIVRSAESAQILGIDEAAQVTGQGILAKVHPDDRERFKAAVAGLSPEKPYLQISHRMVHPDGTAVWVERSSRAHFDEQGRMLRIVGMVVDITERKLAEDRLREYEKAVEGSEEMIAVVDREYRYLIANRKFLSLRNMAKEQVVGRLADEVLNEGVFEAGVKERLDECFRGRVVRFEMKYTYPELGERDVFVSYFPIEGATGIDRVACIMQDITDRKRTEGALRKSEERFRLAAQAGKMYAYEWDVATDVVMRSEEQANVLGFSDQAKQLTRQQLVARVHPDDRTLFLGSVDQVTPENPATRISYRMLRPDGSVVWLEKSARGFFDEQGKLVRMIGMVVDITERKRAEAAKRESEDRLQLLLDSTAEAIYGNDLEGRCTFCNPACLRALGYERVDELLGKNMHDLIHHTRSDGSLLPVEECRIFRAFRTGEGVHVDDEVLWRANRTSFPAEYWSYPQRRGQEIVGAVVTFVDITERKLAEAALANVSRRLIEAHEEERSWIARELHDDVNQRMALLAIELDRWNQQLPPSAVELHDHIRHASQRLSDIAADIQALSHRLHSSKLEYLGLVAAAKSFCQELSAQQKVEIDFSHTAIPRSVPEEISLCLFRVLQETLQNAVKHSGVRHFRVELCGTEGEIQLTVSDLGMGFDPQDAIHRHGLGLISMLERMQLVSGEISIKSHPGSGTTIHARVPFRSISDSARAAG